jgi:dTDP-4-dehydrorhamnose reductase
MCGLLRDLADGKPEVHPAANGAGWWRRDIRMQFRPVFRSVTTPEPKADWRTQQQRARPVLIAGKTGTLGKALARACEWRGLDYVLTDRTVLDLADDRSVKSALDRFEPWAVINAAGWVRVDDAEDNEHGCFEANARGAIALAEACAARGVQFAGFSSDLVFDGAAGRAYLESDRPNPLNAYGRSKAAAEEGVLGSGGTALMIRTAAFFSPYDPHNFAAHVVRTLARGHQVRAAADQVVSPTYVPDLVDAVLDLVIDGEQGVWHLANDGAASWAAFGVMIARALGLDERLVLPAKGSELALPAPRPSSVVLRSERGWIMPPLENAVERYAAILTAAEFAAEVEAEIDREITPAALQAAVRGPDTPRRLLD